MVVKSRHRDTFRRFFTEEEALTDYMVQLLHLSESDTLLEPCAGDGHLIDAALRVEPLLDVTAYELHQEHASGLTSKYSQANVKVYNRDTIMCPDLDLRETFGSRFTKILANPPYGGWQDYERRQSLKIKYPGLYVRETYTLFLYRCLRLLADGGRLVFIIPSTFLYLHLHSPIRRFLLSEYSIESIDVFKSSLFPGISFGYADLCIIAVRSKKPLPLHAFSIRRIESLKDFSSQEPNVPSFEVRQDSLVADEAATIPLKQEDFVSAVDLHETKLLGEVASCVTGFYSGNDRVFLRRLSPEVRRSSSYQCVLPESVADASLLMSDPPLAGLHSEKHFIPILKGGGYSFWKPAQWFVDWSEAAVAHYKSDAKSRFQNSSFYFRQGIGFPMVTSTKPTASLIDGCLFDQSIVGVFPFDSDDLYYLLAYCNSARFWNSVRAINPSANNSAKYLKRVRIAWPDLQTRSRIANLSQKIVTKLRNGDSDVKKMELEISTLFESQDFAVSVKRNLVATA